MSDFLNSIRNAGTAVFNAARDSFGDQVEGFIKGQSTNIEGVYSPAGNASVNPAASNPTGSGAPGPSQDLNVLQPKNNGFDTKQLMIYGPIVALVLVAGYFIVKKG